ncbi:MAG: YCF48-related protein [Bacteroidia bacterium]
MKKIAFLILYGVALCSFGQSWNPIASPTALTINSSSFISPDTGWVVTNDFIFKTTDGGITWTSQSYPPDPAHDIRMFNSVHFINQHTGIIGCGNYLYTGVDLSQVSCFLWTNDGGANWTYKNLGSSTDYILDAKLTSPTTAFGTGQYGEAWATFDAGATWTNMYYTSPYSGCKLFPISRDTAYYAGVENISNKAAFGRIVDSSWTASTVISGGTSYFGAIYFFNRMEGWLGGSSGLLYKTTNGGLSWISFSSGVTSYITDIIFTDSFNGWFCTNDGKICHTNDSGASWSLEYNGTVPLTDLSFSGNTGYAVGNTGTILKYSLPDAMIENRNEHSFLLFPNPTQSTISMEIELSGQDPLKIEIKNVLGHSVYADQKDLAPGRQKLDLNVADLPPGIYLLELRSRERTLNATFVKQ